MEQGRCHGTRCSSDREDTATKQKCRKHSCPLPGAFVSFSNHSPGPWRTGSPGMYSPTALGVSSPTGSLPAAASSPQCSCLAHSPALQPVPIYTWPPLLWLCLCASSSPYNTSSGFRARPNPEQPHFNAAHYICKDCFQIKPRSEAQGGHNIFSRSDDTLFTLPLNFPKAGGT